MNKDVIYALVFLGSYSLQHVYDQLNEEETEELQKLAKILYKEYGISLANNINSAKENIETLSAQLKEKNFIVLKNTPIFPIPDEIFVRDKKKFPFPPPKMGKIDSKPKGRKRNYAFKGLV